MGLADLKKKAISIEPTAKGPVTIEEFISDAERYAAGELAPYPNLKRTTIELDFNDKKSNTPQALDSCRANKAKFRHATFSLSEMAITQLSELAKRKNIAKSRLLRQLIARDFHTQIANK